MVVASSSVETPKEVSVAHSLAVSVSHPFSGLGEKVGTLSGPITGFISQHTLQHSKRLTYVNLGHFCNDPEICIETNAVGSIDKGGGGPLNVQTLC